MTQWSSHESSWSTKFLRLCGGCAGTVARSWKWDSRRDVFSSASFKKYGKTTNIQEQIPAILKSSKSVILVGAIWTWIYFSKECLAQNQLPHPPWWVILALDIELEMDPHDEVIPMVEKDIKEISDIKYQVVMVKWGAKMNLNIKFVHDMLFISRGQSLTSIYFHGALWGEICWTSACRICCILGLGNESTCPSWGHPVATRSELYAQVESFREDPAKSNLGFTEKSGCKGPMNQPNTASNVQNVGETYDDKMMRSWKPYKNNTVSAWLPGRPSTPKATWRIHNNAMHHSN